MYAISRLKPSRSRRDSGGPPLPDATDSGGSSRHRCAPMFVNCISRSAAASTNPRPVFKRVLWSETKARNEDSRDIGQFSFRSLPMTDGVIMQAHSGTLLFPRTTSASALKP